uniref:Uncharacterized protein n=1 Tax=Brassica campestris TaxID=3711 RepID=M4EFD3_BRACM
MMLSSVYHTFIQQVEQLVLREREWQLRDQSCIRDVKLGILSADEARAGEFNYRTRSWYEKPRSRDAEMPTTPDDKRTEHHSSSSSEFESDEPEEEVFGNHPKEVDGDFLLMKKEEGGDNNLGDDTPGASCVSCICSKNHKLSTTDQATGSGGFHLLKQQELRKTQSGAQQRSHMFQQQRGSLRMNPKHRC